jgi:hypothetical protein
VPDAGVVLEVQIEIESAPVEREDRNRELKIAAARAIIPHLAGRVAASVARIVR